VEAYSIDKGTKMLGISQVHLALEANHMGWGQVHFSRYSCLHSVYMGVLMSLLSLLLLVPVSMLTTTLTTWLAGSLTWLCILLLLKGEILAFALNI